MSKGVITFALAALLAVPLVAAAKVVVLHVWDTRSQWPPRAEPVPPPRPVSEARGSEFGDGAKQDGAEAPARPRHRLSG